MRALNSSWNMTGEWRGLAGADVHVWMVNLPLWNDALDQCRAVLPMDELQRNERFRQPLHRDRDLLCRGILRLLLAKYLECDARQLPFAHGPHGKPALRDHELQFNISHSADFAVFAFTRAGEIGVDIELVRDDMPRQWEIAQKYFSAAEVEQLAVFPESERNTAFFRCWTRKEAYVKARGDGIFAGLQKFAVTLSPDDARLLHTPDPGPWWMAALPQFGGCVGTVVVAAKECSLCCWQLEPQFLFGKN